MNKIWAVLLALILTDCAGTKFEWSEARKVQVGTTEEELVRLLGKPYLVRTRGDVQVWVWSYVDGMVGRRGVVSYELRDGRVTAIPNTAPFE